MAMKIKPRPKEKPKCRECEFELMGGEERCPSCGKEIEEEW